jgi:hypothetical protein
MGEVERETETATSRTQIDVTEEPVDPCEWELGGSSLERR